MTRRLRPDPDLHTPDVVSALRAIHHGLGLAPIRIEALHRDLPTALAALEEAMTPSGGGSSSQRPVNAVSRPTEGAMLARMGTWPNPDPGKAPALGPVPQRDRIIAACRDALAALALADRLVADVTRKANAEETAITARQHRCQPTAGEAGAVEWYADGPCNDLATKDGLCAKHYMRRYRWRESRAVA
jgi:hypothetical protein